MKEVLILGNGISRLNYLDYIEKWQKELWACNFVYKDPKLENKVTRIMGHISVMRLADNYKKKYNRKYLLYGIDIFPTCDPVFVRDSGTFLVAQALFEGYKVYCCGFDLGGKDLFVPNHDEQNKSMWVQRWRLIASRYTLDNVNFIGYDHKPYILSNASIYMYAQRYQKKEPHIMDEGYFKLHENFKEPIIEKGEEDECEEVQRHMSTNRGVRFN